MKVKFKHKRAEVVATVKQGKLTELHSVKVQIDNIPIEIKALITDSVQVMRLLEAAAVAEVNNKVRSR